MIDIELKSAEVEQKKIENMALLVKPLDNTPQITT
jgi:hypothetical protein